MALCPITVIVTLMMKDSAPNYPLGRRDVAGYKGGVSPIGIAGKQKVTCQVCAATHFRTLYENSLVVAINQPGEAAQEAFFAVVNDEDQHALWQAGLDVPPGWR